MNLFVCFRQKNRRQDDLIINLEQIESVSPGDKKDYYIIVVKSGEKFEVNISYKDLMNKLKFDNRTFEEFIDEKGDVYYRQIDDSPIKRKIKKEINTTHSSEIVEVLSAYVMWMMEVGYKKGMKEVYKNSNII